MTAVDTIREHLHHDLQAEGVHATVRIEELPSEPSTDLRILLTYGQWNSREVWLQSETTRAQQLAEVADALQDDLAGMDGLVIWPSCPGHPHQAATRIDDGVAWWACPKTEERLGRIGDLPTEGT